jgi:DNA-directed RNA polymerase specialized sigma24 family protein
VKAARPADDVLEALDALLVVLRESTQRNQVATRRAQTIRRLRSHGRSYHEILGRVSGTSTLGITRQNVDCLSRANDRLQRAEVLALHGEDVAVADIAALCGITTQHVTVLVAPGA